MEKILLQHAVHIIVFPQGAELHARSLDGFHVFAISIDEQIIDHLQPDHETNTQQLLKKGGVIKAPLLTIESLRQYLFSTYKALSRNPTLVSTPAFHKKFCGELTHRIFAILSSGSERNETLPFHKQVHLLEDIDNWLVGNMSEPHSVAEICRHFHVNERTLRRVFFEHMGVSPHRYLVSLRLDGIRKELLIGGNKNIIIADVANNWGFWHMGQFAQVYKRQFEELPSMTLQRKTNSSHCWNNLRDNQHQVS